MLFYYKAVMELGFFAGIQWTSDLNRNFIRYFCCLLVLFDCLSRILAVILQHLFTFCCHFSAIIKQKASGIRLRVRVGCNFYASATLSEQCRRRSVLVLYGIMHRQREKC